MWNASPMASALPDETGQPYREVARGRQRPGALAVVVHEHRFALLQPRRERIARAGDRVRNPAMRVGVRRADDSHRETGFAVRCCCSHCSQASFFCA